MYFNINILDVDILSYYLLMSNSSYESIGLLISSIILVISELWYTTSQLYSILYILIYIGAIVIIFIFILSLINKKDEYLSYNTILPYNQAYGLFILFFILIFDDLDYNDKSYNYYTYDIFNLYNIFTQSDLSTIGYHLYTEYALLILLISYTLLLSILGIIIINDNKNK